MCSQPAFCYMLTAVPPTLHMMPVPNRLSYSAGNIRVPHCGVSRDMSTNPQTVLPWVVFTTTRPHIPSWRQDDTLCVGDVPLTSSCSIGCVEPKALTGVVGVSDVSGRLCRQRCQRSQPCSWGKEYSSLAGRGRCYGTDESHPG